MMYVICKKKKKMDPGEAQSHFGPHLGLYLSKSTSQITIKVHCSHLYSLYWVNTRLVWDSI